MYKLKTTLLCMLLVCLNCNFVFAQKKQLLKKQSNNRANQFQFDCSTILPKYGCNYVFNPLMEFNNPNIQIGTPTQTPFTNNLIDGWADSHGDVDVNDVNNINFTPFPPPFGGLNFASIGCGGSTSDEGICTKITRLSKGKSYGFSFFRAMSSPQNIPIENNTNIKLRILLIKCQNFNSNGNYGIPQPPIFPDNYQEVFCENLGYTELNWQQGITTFIANDDYDMLWIFPELNSGVTMSPFFVHFAYPQIFINDFSSISAFATYYNSNCGVSLSAVNNCSIPNISFSWFDPNGRFIGGGNQISLNNGVIGKYMLVWDINSTISNSCNATNYISNQTFVNVVDFPCNCNLENGELYISSATMRSLHRNDGINSSNEILVDLLSLINDNCEMDFCHFIDEGFLTFNLASNQTNGNIWEVYRDGIPSSSSISNIVAINNSNNSSSAYTETFYFKNFNTPSVIEIRLTNVNVNKVKSIFIKLKPQADLYNLSCFFDQQGLRHLTFQNNIYTSSQTSYSWDFSNAPLSFQNSVNQASVNSPEIIFDPTSVTNTFIVTMTTFNSAYNCEIQKNISISPFGCGELGSKVAQNININKNKFNNYVKLYPNPARKSFYLTSKKKIQRVILKSIDGKIIKQIDIESCNKMIDIYELNSGIFLVEVHYSDRTSEVLRVLKE